MAKRAEDELKNIFHVITCKEALEYYEDTMGIRLLQAHMHMTRAVIYVLNAQAEKEPKALCDT